MKEVLFVSGSSEGGSVPQDHRNFLLISLNCNLTALQSLPACLLPTFGNLKLNLRIMTSALAYVCNIEQVLLRPFHLVFESRVKGRSHRTADPASCCANNPKFYR